MNLFLVRHGQTQSNLDGLLHGWHDVALTAEGERQTELTATALHSFTEQQGLAITSIYSSPLSRALRTAQAIGRAYGIEPMLDPDLREIHFGEIEGHTITQWQEKYPHLIESAADGSNLDFAWPGGETRKGFYDRAIGVIDRLVASHSETDNIVVVSHGGVISAFVSYVMIGDPGQWRKYRSDNCSITRLTLEGSRVASPSCLISFNDINHLADSVVTPWPTEE